MRKIVVLAVIVGLLAGISYPARAQFQILRHDEDAAAVSAEEFARVAFVQRSYQRAYELFSSEQKQRLTAAQVTEAIRKMHVGGFPSHVAATEFEPMPGQKAMNIFLRGKSEKEDFYYRFVMEGTEETGYRVAGFFRGSGPYPASPMRMQLKNKAVGEKGH